MQSHQEDASTNLDEEHRKSRKQSDMRCVSSNHSKGDEKSPSVSPNLCEEHEQNSNQSDSATVPFCLGKEHEKYPKQSDFPTVSSIIGKVQEENPELSDSATDSSNLHEEHENISMQSDPENDSFNHVEKHEKSLKQSDYACESPIDSKEHQKSDNQSDFEDSSKLIEEYQKAIKSAKKKHKRSSESAVRETFSHDDEHQNTDKQSDLEDSFKLSEEYQKAVKSVKKKHKRSDIARDNVGSESAGNPSKQLVLYDPSATGAEYGSLVAAHDLDNNTPFRNFLGSHSSARVCPAIGSFTVQCATCFKWRLIPTKEKYEEIRETILQNPFRCERVREWRPDISCEDPTDISQDGSRVWAMDKPNIAQAPPGWERILRIRGEGGTKFADVYYAAPCGKRLRSMLEVQRYLLLHPEYVQQGVRLSQFSFQIPRPLQENYVRKRPPTTARLTGSSDPGGLEFSRPLEPSEVNPLSWAPPPTRTELEAGVSDCPSSNGQTAVPSQLHKTSLPRPMKLKVTMSSSKPLYNNATYDHPKVKLGDERSKSNNGSVKM